MTSPRSLAWILVTLALAACAGAPKKAASSSARAETRLETAIHRAHAELERITLADGRFVYLYDSLDRRPPSRDYNITRHGGAMYAFGMYFDRFANEKSREALRRSARYLQQEGMKPSRLHGTAVSVVVASPPLKKKKDHEAYGTLGAAALGMVGLLSADRIAPGSVEEAKLRGLRAFLLGMQKPNGDFYPRFLMSQQKATEKGYVLYYAGEATLAFTMLYERDHDPALLEAALRAMRFLAHEREGKGANVPADNWALVATEKLLKLPISEEDRRLLLTHAEQIVESDLSFQVNDAFDPFEGSYSRRGATTPTSTHLEGLLSALAFLPEEKAELREKIRHSATRAIRFLIRAQIPSGLHEGALPANLFDLANPPANRHASEVRVDYIQHALSAMLRARDLGLEP